MTITYDHQTNRYHATDATGNWYATGCTMIEAIQHALSTKLYWNSIKK